MNLHILYENKNLCGRTRTVGGSVPWEQWAKSNCQECIKKLGEKCITKVGHIKAAVNREASRSVPASSCTPTTAPSYDPTLDLVNPLNPLSPFSPLYHSDPAPSHDHSPHHDPSPSYDPPSHDSGSSYDSGGCDSGGSGGGGGD
jgi:hypothetical protein